MTENLEKIRTEFDIYIDTRLDALTSPEIVQRGLEIEKKLSEQH